MLKTLGAAAAILLFTVSAQAAGEMRCTSPDGMASIAMTLGSLPVLNVIGARADIDGEVYAVADEEGATTVAVGQAAFTTGGLVVDFTDPNVEDILLSVRIATATEGGEAAAAGVLTIPGTAAIAVTCEGP